MNGGYVNFEKQATTMSLYELKVHFNSLRSDSSPAITLL